MIMLTSVCISRSLNFPLVVDSWGRGLSSGPIRRAQVTVSGAVRAEGFSAEISKLEQVIRDKARGVCECVRYW